MPVSVQMKPTGDDFTDLILDDQPKSLKSARVQSVWLM